MNIALVPVKRLGAGKSRLTGVLPRADLDALTLAMLGDVLEALGQVACLNRRVVVTPDATIAEAARVAKAEAFVRGDPGLNESLDDARDALGDPAGSTLVVLGDVAGARGAELSSLYEAAQGLGGRGVVLAPARDGGTAALLCTPSGIIPHCFGSESAKAHRHAAETRDVPFVCTPLPSLAIDLDTADDLRALLASDTPAPRTRRLLSGRDLGAH